MCTVSDVAIFGQMAIYGQIKVIEISTNVVLDRPLFSFNIQF